jgi:hypothetical protein
MVFSTIFCDMFCFIKICGIKELAMVVFVSKACRQAVSLQGRAWQRSVWEGHQLSICRCSPDPSFSFPGLLRMPSLSLSRCLKPEQIQVLQSLKLLHCGIILNENIIKIVNSNLI